MASLVDSSILVSRFDPRFPAKQQLATALLREGLATNSVRIPYQAIIEFVAATTRQIPGGGSILSPTDARREAEDLVNQFPVYYPNETILRTALRGAAAYQLSWFAAHLWAYAEYYGLSPLYSVDFEHHRAYGTVQVINPFLSGPTKVPEGPTTGHDPTSQQMRI